MKRAIGCALVGWLIVTGCGSSDDGGSGKPAGPTLIGAPGVALNEIAIYQGPKRQVMVGGAPAEGVPLIAGRDGLFRVFHSLTPDYDGQPVTAKLDLLDGQPPLEATLPLSPAASEADLASTVTFQIPGSRIGQELNYELSFSQPAAGGRADNPGSRFSQKVAVAGKQNTFRVMLVPFAYDADGSGRLPDTSAEQVELYRKRFLSLYPVSNVEVTTHEPVPWSSTISPNGTGWQAVGLKLYSLRNAEGIPPDVYLYGVFMPTQTLSQFCFPSCLLGVTLLNDKPLDVGQVSLRLALGVGYPDVALNTAAHELGHAHGRPHANCGPGLDPSSIDPSFPHPNGAIGDWGYDITNGQLHDPAVATDIMSYCKNQFISGYNYTKLFDRSQNVNQPKVIAKPERYWLIADDGLGGSDWREIELTGLPSGREVEVTAETRAKSGIATRGWYTPYDHLDGGWLLVPAEAGDLARVEHRARGKLAVLER